MKRQNETGSSTVVSGGVRHALLAGVAVISILLLAFTMIMQPVAHAEEVGKEHNASELAPGQVAESGADSATVLVYMNGSDLESEAGEASSDIAEMLKSGIGANANVVIETLGTRKWQDFGIASDHTQRYAVRQGNLELVDDSLGRLDTTHPDTLANFISWGVANYPADRYVLLFWDHGAGPVYGFGYDEFRNDYSALTLDEMQKALAANSNVHFDIIGMDCCIMGSLETCLVLQPYCDYAILSEDFEPGIGWSYENWMRVLEQNPSVSSVELGKVVVNDMITEVEADAENGDATLALIDESAVDDLYAAWVNFAYANESELLSSDLSQEVEWRDRPNDGLTNNRRTPGPIDTSAYDSLSEWNNFWEGWDYDTSYVTMTDYAVTDIANVMSSVGGEKSSALNAAFNKAVAYFGSTSGEEGMGGLGITLPYGDAELYNELTKVFTACGIDASYIQWLESFVEVGDTDSLDGQGSDYSSGYGYGFGHDPEYEYGYDAGYGSGYDSDFGYGYGSGCDQDSENDLGFGHDSWYGYGGPREPVCDYGFNPNDGCAFFSSPEPNITYGSANERNAEWWQA